ncbi:MAG: phosphoribosylformylglycinamidine cyclo-ligase, partial [Desulfosudaceae bacterium]
ADAGVDIDKGNDFVKQVKKLAGQTSRRGVMSDIGGFGAFFSLDTTSLKNPVLVSATDGVGTKLKIAFMTGKHDTIGIDLVAMSVNDIAVQGARPLFFLDYFSCGRLDLETATAVVSGIAEGCRRAECALIGGETAEMPDMYQPGEYDLAGFAVGVTDNENIIDGSDIRVGDQIIGIASNGLHSNGFSLVRKICFERLGLKPDQHMEEFGRCLGEELLAPTRIYTATIKNLQKLFSVHGLAHITGGGLAENLARVLPNGCVADIAKGSWEVPPIFSFLQQGGQVTDEEMARTFNNGIGLVAVVPGDQARDAVEKIRALGETPFIIGEISAGNDPETRVRWR